MDLFKETRSIIINYSNWTVKIKDQETAEILSRRTKNNAILVGEAGVGKTAVVEGLAQAIVAGKVPETIQDKEIYSIDLSSLEAGTQYRGSFEENIQQLVEGS